MPSSMPSALTAVAPRRRAPALLVVVLALVAGTLVALGPAAPAEAGPRSPRASDSVRVDLGQARFGPIDGWGVDVKQKCRFDAKGCRSRAQVYAQDKDDIVRRTFGGGRFSWIRVSFRADRRGLVDRPGGAMPAMSGRYYRPTIRAIRNILAVDPSIRVFASRDTVNDCDPDNKRVAADRPKEGTPGSCPDFHPWTKVGNRHGGQVVPARYGRLAASYVDYMSSQGVPVDVLGLDNEPHNNEGRLTPPRFLAAARALRASVTTSMPRLMMNCANMPDLRWLRKAAPGVVRHLDLASAHSHPKRRLLERSVSGRFARLARRRGLVPYNTEMHWNHTPRAFDGAAQSLRSVFDQLDVGFRGFSAWAHTPIGDHGGRKDDKARILNELYDSTFRARLVRTTDFDGASTNDGRVTTRAFRRGRVVHLWIVNDRSSGHSAKALDLRARGRTLSPRSATYQRWFVPRKGGISRVSGRLGRRGGLVRVGIPRRSATLVRVVL